MTLAMELERQNRAGYLKGKQEGRQEGRHEGIAQSVVGMLKAGATVEFAAKVTNYPVEKIQEFARQHRLI